MFEQPTNNNSISNISCVVPRCGRRPSLMGREPMYLVPFGTTHYIFCGECMKDLMREFDKDTYLDLMNLFTHANDYLYKDYFTKILEEK